MDRPAKPRSPRQSSSPPGVWHHVAAVVDKLNASVRLYVDGVDQTQTSALQPDFNSQAELNLGRFADGSFMFKGSMDEIRIEQEARSSDWIWASWLSVAQNQAMASYSPVALQPACLSLSASGTAVDASWAATGVGLVLYVATNLGSPTLWTRIPDLPALVTSQWQIGLRLMTNGPQFFRLKSE